MTPASTTEGRRTAVVTGASSGIGEATARLLAAQGFRVVCAARRAERVEALAAEIGGTALACDVTSDDDVSTLSRVAGGRVHVLVNNAGGALGLEPVAEADVALWRRMYDTNVLGTLRVTRPCCPPSSPRTARVSSSTSARSPVTRHTREVAGTPSRSTASTS